MKTFALTLIFFLSLNATLFAGNYESTMGQNLQKLFTTQNSDELILLGNTFVRIGQKENQWLPFYYASYANLSVLFNSDELSVSEKNKILDKAQAELEKAMMLDENQSELHVLQAFIYQMRITDPAQGYQYSTLSNESLAKALLLDSDNPRYYYMKGTNLFYTPKQFGGGKSAAKPFFEKAKTLFETENHENTLYPTWGSQHNQTLLNSCN